MKVLIISIGILAACLVGALSQIPERKPEKLTLTLALIGDSEKGAGKEYVFIINGLAAYRTLEGLKKYVRDLPKKSVLTWSPGCCRMGDEPLLSSQKELAEFKAFCEGCGISFVLVPSG